MSEVIDLITANWQAILTVISTAIGAIGLDRRYKIVNKARALIAKAINAGIEFEIYLNYSTSKLNNLQEISAIIFKEFNDDVKFKVKHSSPTRIDFNYNIFSVFIIIPSKDSLTIGIDRMSAGVRDFENKVEKFLSKIEVLKKALDKNIILDFESTEITLELPYKFEHLDVSEPKNFVIKKYTVSYNPQNEKTSQIDVILNKEKSDKQKIIIKSEIQNSILGIIKRFT